MKVRLVEGVEVHCDPRKLSVCNWMDCLTRIGYDIEIKVRPVNASCT